MPKRILETREAPTVDRLGEKHTRRLDTESILKELDLVLKLAGIEKQTVDLRFIDRLKLMVERSPFIDYEINAIQLVDPVINMYNSLANKKNRESRQANPKLQPFSGRDRETVKIASLGSDVGKTGPIEAGWSKADQDFLTETILDLYNIEGIPPQSHSAPITKVLRAHFPDFEKRIEILKRISINTHLIPMKEFWEMHSLWTKNILLAANARFPRDAGVVAISHHLLDGIPEEIIAELFENFDRSDQYRQEFKPAERFGIREKLVIILDKYEACRTRGGKLINGVLTYPDHSQAISYLRSKIAANGRYTNDPEFAALVEATDLALKDLPWQPYDPSKN